MQFGITSGLRPFRIQDLPYRFRDGSPAASQRQLSFGQAAKALSRPPQEICQMKPFVIRATAFVALAAATPAFAARQRRVSVR